MASWMWPLRATQMGVYRQRGWHVQPRTARRRIATWWRANSGQMLADREVASLRGGRPKPSDHPGSPLRHQGGATRLAQAVVFQASALAACLTVNLDAMITSDSRRQPVAVGHYAASIDAI